MQPEQGTDAWRKERAGKVTASRIAEVVAKTKSGYSTSRANYAAQLIAERLTGQPQDRLFTNAAIQWGNDTEPQARAAYEFFTGHSVTLAPFVHHPIIKLSGASPDGFVNDEGLLEVKCPLTSTHIETLLGDEIDKKYMLQMTWQMACTGRRWCEFVSFDPRLPSDLQLHIRRVERDEKLIAELEAEVSTFLAEIEKKVAALQFIEVGRMIPNDPFDPATLSRQMLESGEEWADKNAAADALEESRKSLRSQIALKFIPDAGSVSKAEMMAEATREYIDHVKDMVEARRVANRSKVQFDTCKVYIELLRSQESTRREEMRIR